ncbi:MAG: hypothetical protein M1813_009120 [Trichoglossum hirsutum]|nr:MAG: hypothetical protein M1813_009120 [Trichoglossum hirsutum]
MPFEGAGAISSWQLELPEILRQFDYQSISGIIHLQYKSMNGGKALGAAASSSVSDYIRSVIDISDTEGLYAAFDVPHMTFPRNGQQSSAPKLRPLAYLRSKSRTNIHRFTPKAISQIGSSRKIITEGTTVLGFSTADRAAGAKLSVLKSGDSCKVANWKVGVGDVVTSMKQYWILIGYSLK